MHTAVDFLQRAIVEVHRWNADVTQNSVRVQTHCFAQGVVPFAHVVNERRKVGHEEFVDVVLIREPEQIIYIRAKVIRSGDPNVHVCINNHCILLLVGIG